MSEGFLIDPSGTSPLELGDASGTLYLTELNLSPAAKNPEWATRGDGDGAKLVRPPFRANAENTMKVRVRATTMDDAITAIGPLIDKLQEAENVEDGMPVQWTPNGASTSRIIRIFTGQVTDFPMTPDDGWFASVPVFTISFTRDPRLYGEEQGPISVTGTDPLVTVQVDDVGGDMPAVGRVVVTDGASEARRYVEWGLEQLHYDSGSPSDLLLDASGLVTTGFAGTAGALSGAYGGTAIGATLVGQPVALCGTGRQPHVGTFRVKARIFAHSTNQYWRLSWQDGDGPFSQNDLVTPVVGADFSEVDLGLINITPAEVGSQKWQGRVEAYTTDTAGEAGNIDYLKLIPAGEGYGRAQAAYNYQGGVITAHDEFTGTTAGTALSGRTAPAGGSWATSGATTDFKFSDNGFTTGSEEITRITTSDSGTGRFAILGSTSSTDTEAGVVTLATGARGGLTPGALAFGLQQALVLRYVDSSNYLLGGLYVGVGAGTDPLASWHLAIIQVVAGTVTTLADSIVATAFGSVQRALRFIAFASGRAVLSVLNWPANTVLATVEASSSALATGGTLASGKRGLNDYNPVSTTTSRWYDNFYVATPAEEPICIYPGESIEFRSDDTLRADSTGTYYGRPPRYRGSRVFIPPAGDAGRSSRVVVSAHENDIENAADTPLGDSTTVDVYWTPCYSTLPR